MNNETEALLLSPPSFPEDLGDWAFFNFVMIAKKQEAPLFSYHITPTVKQGEIGVKIVVEPVEDAVVWLERCIKALGYTPIMETEYSYMVFFETEIGKAVFKEMFFEKLRNAQEQMYLCLTIVAIKLIDERINQKPADKNDILEIMCQIHNASDLEQCFKQLFEKKYPVGLDMNPEEAPSEMISDLTHAPQPEENSSKVDKNLLARYVDLAFDLAPQITKWALNNNRS